MVAEAVKHFGRSRSGMRQAFREDCGGPESLDGFRYLSFHYSSQTRLQWRPDAIRQTELTRKVDAVDTD
jgi:hypothetical protein